MLRKIKTLFIIVLLPCQFSCENGTNPTSTQFIPNNNYIQYTYNRQQFIVAQQIDQTFFTLPASSISKLNFGLETNINSNDTSYTIEGITDNFNIVLTFPRTDTPVTFNIYKNSRSHFPNVQYSDNINPMNFYATPNLMETENANSEKIGEIQILKIDRQNRLIEGTFDLWVYLFSINNNIVVSKNDSIELKNGKFHYQWEKDASFLNK